MGDVESTRAQAEALNEPVGRALRSARRAQMWAGLNRYLASEAAHARRVEDKEEEAEKPEESTGSADEDTDEDVAEGADRATRDSG